MSKLVTQWKHIGGPEKFWVIAGILFLAVDVWLLVLKLLDRNYVAAIWVFMLGLVVIASIVKWFTTDLHPSIRNKQD
jgi:hypothetical protein